MIIENLILKAQNLPTTPGCYMMKKKQGNTEQILYIGKAKNLRNRVISYFREKAKHNNKTEILVRHITDFDFISTSNETEALVLENNLIKKYSPKYNIRLKDDKTYPYLVVDLEEPFPRLVYTRKILRKKNLKIYGPYVTGSRISEVLKIIIKSFQLRDCSLHEFRSRKTACLLYQMNQCSAPCVGYIDNPRYLQNLDLALSILDGHEKKALKYLEEQMYIQAEKEHFEMAATLRDHLLVLTEFCQVGKQKNVELGIDKKNIDIVAYYKGTREVEISIYMIRSGLLLGHKDLNFYLKESRQSFDDELVSYVFRYYSQISAIVPDIVVTNFLEEKRNLLSEALSVLKQSNVVVRSPGRKFLSLYDLTKMHALEYQKSRLKTSGSPYVGLLKLADILNLKEIPVLLECYDIAIFSGSSPTASQIVFFDGQPDKKLYRHYKLQELPEGNNDFAMMKEVLRRRIPHGNLPDVFIVDGGIQQVNMFRQVLNEFAIIIPVVGIAKSKILKQKNQFIKKQIEKTQERLIIPGRSNPYLLSKDRELFQIITSMRDEAHRFSRRLHHKLESGRVIVSDLDNISGIGPKIRTKILKNLTMPLDKISLLSLDEISKALDIHLQYAKLIKKYFSSKNE